MINVVCGVGSTGRICTDLAKEYEERGHEVKIAYGRENVPEEYQKYAVRIGTDWDVRFHALKARLFDTAGFGSTAATRRFIEWTREYDPDEIHLHNLHGYYVNVEILFQYLREYGKRIKWTLHDCWPFTGHCVHFTMAKCSRWQTGCFACPNKMEYPSCFFLDRSPMNYQKKKRIFTGIPALSFITPSKWLAGLVQKSFLKEYPVEVRYNTIDTSVFKPTPSDFRKRYGLQDKTIILGVASKWEKRKGLDDFVELAKMLDGSYTIVLVGADEKTVNRRILNSRNIKTPSQGKAPHLTNHKGTTHQVVPEGVQNLYQAIIESNPAHKDVKHAVADHMQEKTSSERRKEHSKIICIPKTDNKQELAAIYTASDFFVNPTHEDNFPTVNLEAAACDTCVITYDVGGAAETVKVSINEDTKQPQ